MSVVTLFVIIENRHINIYNDWIKNLRCTNRILYTAMKI